MLLADSLTQVTPGTYGVLAIVGLQVAQFIFAYRKDARGSDAAKKEDLKTLKADLQQQIRDAEDALDEHKRETERKLEAYRADADRSRSALHEKVNEVSTKTAAVLKGQELMEQSLNSLGNKLDAVRHKLSN